MGAWFGKKGSISADEGVKMKVVERFSFLWNVYRRFDYRTRRAWSRLGHGSVFVDVGANVGEISRAAHAKGAVVHCIEPNPWAMHSLQRAFSKEDRTYIYDFAASKSDGTAHLFLHKEHEDNPTRFSSGSSLVGSKPNVSETGLSVPSRDFSAFLLELGRVDFLKIDIEGHEVELVPYLVGSLDWDLIGFVAVETHDKAKWSDLRAPTSRMKKLVEAAGLATKFSWNWP